MRGAVSGILPKDYTDMRVDALDKRIDQRIIDLEKAMLLAVEMAKDEAINKSKNFNQIFSVMLGCGGLIAAIWAAIKTVGTR